MSGSQRRGGMIQLQIGGVLHDAHGAFTYGLGTPERAEIEGSASILGYSEKPKAAFIEGVIIDKGTLDSEALMTASDVTVTLTLGNGKVVTLDNAWQANAFNGETEEGMLDVRFVSSSKAEVVS